MCTPAPITLLDLTDDLLNVIASHLPPTSRLRLATTSKRVHNAVWSTHAETHIIHNYPLERTISFPLQVHVPHTNSNSSFRTVPARSRQQHLSIAINPTGTLIAVIPYDNILRLICPKQCVVLLAVPVPDCFTNDVWDVSKGMRQPQPRPEQVVYADDAGLDVETTLDFSNDGLTLVVASRLAVTFFKISNSSGSGQVSGSSSSSSSGSGSGGWSIHAESSISIDDCLRLIQSQALSNSRPASHSYNSQPSPPPYQYHQPSLQHHFNNPHLQPQHHHHHHHHHQETSPYSPAGTGHTAHNALQHQQSTGGAAQLSPDGQRLAWVIFIGTPAVVHLTVWKRDTRTGQWVPEISIEADRVWTRRWAALAWARPIFTPNSKYLLLVVNCAHKVTRVVNVNGEFHRTKLCRFAFIRVQLSDVHGEDGTQRRTEWLDLASDVYPRLLAEAIERSLKQCVIHDIGTLFATACGSNTSVSSSSLYSNNNIHHHASDEGNSNKSSTDAGENGKEDEVILDNMTQLMRTPGMVFNSVHSCPAEATYKALSFGEATHPWFVSKQPMFSFHFSPSGRRVILAPSPHINIMRTLIIDRQYLQQQQPQSQGQSGPNGNINLFDEAYLMKKGDDPVGKLRNRHEQCRRRRDVFETMPWRESFATVTAFSNSGQWLAGASLLDDDRCCVCLRNVTMQEYFGEYANSKC